MSALFQFEESFERYTRGRGHEDTMHPNPPEALPRSATVQDEQFTWNEPRQRISPSHQAPPPYPQSPAIQDEQLAWEGFEEFEYPDPDLPPKSSPYYTDTPREEPPHNDQAEYIQEDPRSGWGPEYADGNALELLQKAALANDSAAAIQIGTQAPAVNVSGSKKRNKARHESSKPRRNRKTKRGRKTRRKSKAQKDPKSEGKRRNKSSYKTKCDYGLRQVLVTEEELLLIREHYYLDDMKLDIFKKPPRHSKVDNGERMIRLTIPEWEALQTLRASRGGKVPQPYLGSSIGPSDEIRIRASEHFEKAMKKKAERLLREAAS